MRLEGQAEGGYFPTPDRVIDLLAPWFNFHDYRNKTIRIIDPCAGKGEALVKLRDLLASQLDPSCTVETYGIEENSRRSKTATAALDHVLPADYFTTSITENEFSVLLLNPPYDHSIDERRMEAKFLRVATKLLIPNGGILLFLIPEPLIEMHLPFLTSNYKQLAFRRFPEPEYDRFKQVIIMGTRKWREEPNDYVLRNVSSGLQRGTRIPTLDEYENYDRSFTVYCSDTPSDHIEFTAEQFNPLNALNAIEKSDPFALKEIADLILPPPLGIRTRPLTSLRKGHLAMLLAAGMVNNVVLEQDDQRYIVKGQANKQTRTVEHTRTKKVEAEQLQITLRLLNLNTGEFSTITT